MNNLLKIDNIGQQIWLDQLSHQLLVNGEIQNFITKYGISGLTSNPTIFYKAIKEDKYYINKLAKIKEESENNNDYEYYYEQLILPDIIAACNLFQKKYFESSFKKGYVSLELSPLIANDVNLTITHAKRLWSLINKPNLMIKVPATNAGIDAFYTLISEGINVNITLLFSRKNTIEFLEVYKKAILARASKGLPNKHIKAVASFFISRNDSLIDEYLNENWHCQATINIARILYDDYHNIFKDCQNYMPMELLFASTGTKNPKFSDVLYIDQLICPDTINTVPENTLKAYIDHGKIEKTLLDISLKEAVSNINIIEKQLKQHSTDFEIIANTLKEQGLASFNESYTKLLKLLK